MQSSRLTIFTSCVCALILFLQSCERKAPEEKPPTGEPQASNQATAKPKIDPTVLKTPVTAEEKVSIIDFGRRVEKAVAEKDREFLKTLINMEVIAETAIGDLDVPADFKRGLAIGIKRSGEQVADNLMAAKVDFIEDRVANGNPAILLRMRIAGGLEYLEYQIAKNEELGDWNVIEGYTYSMGTTVSDAMRSMIIPALAESNRSLASKIFSTNPRGEYLQAMPAIGEMTQLARAGEGQKALDLWDGLPGKVKKEKLPMLLRIQAAATLEDFAEEDSAYIAALKEFEAAYPNDPSQALMAIDLNALRGDFPGCHAAIDKLHGLVNDPYLVFFHGYIFLQEEKFAEAEEAARAWIGSDPDDIEGPELLFEIGFATGNHALTAEGLTSLESKFTQDYSAVLTEPEFKPFVNSPEGKAWAAAR